MTLHDLTAARAVPYFTHAIARAIGLPALMILASLAAATAALAQGGADYRLGAGDVVKITVYNNPDLATEAQITDSGKITFPLIGEVTLAGLAKGEAEARLSKLLSEGRFVVNPQVNLLVSLYRSQQVSVLGQVTKPGKFPLDTTSSVTDLLALAGGVAPTGADVVVVIAKGQDGAVKRREIDLNSLMVGGDGAGNVKVANGDIIYVPRAPMFYIYGEVQRPGTYRLERDMTVMQALSVGGGLTLRGTQRGVELHRRDPSGAVQSLQPRLTDRLRENDVVHVKESLF